MIQHESRLQAYRLLVPYGFEVDRDNPLILTAFNRDYDTIPKARIRFARNPKHFEGIWFNTDDGLYMYNDNPASRADYWERLGKLYSHKHVVVGDPLNTPRSNGLRGYI
jgi:hypothetical protein|tara:strand:+ start:3777 stop:4103 length:327 start_codon:yes stop_codon:yes gene_type:complete